MAMRTPRIRFKAKPRRKPAASKYVKASDFDVPPVIQYLDWILFDRRAARRALPPVIIPTNVTPAPMIMPPAPLAPTKITLTREDPTHTYARDALRATASSQKEIGAAPVQPPF